MELNSIVLMNLSTYILTAILYLSPLHENLYAEDPSTRLPRYQSMSQDIAEVVEDPEELPVFTGKFAREKTAILIVSMADHESNYDKNVDTGKKRGLKGEVCFLQIIPNMKHTKFNYTAEYLLGDRKNCIRSALAIVRGADCGGSLPHRLRSYASGRCSKHPDAEKEKIISKAAYGEVVGYLRFMQKYDPSKYFVETI